MQAERTGFRVPCPAQIATVRAAVSGAVPMKTASQPYQTGPVNSPCPPESQRPVGTFADPDAALTQLLYEKRYSLLWEGDEQLARK
jgi:hypothetical protein